LPELHAIPDGAWDCTTGLEACATNPLSVTKPASPYGARCQIKLGGEKNLDIITGMVKRVYTLKSFALQSVYLIRSIYENSSYADFDELMLGSEWIGSTIFHSAGKDRCQPDEWDGTDFTC
jgi:hypothetical protein